MADPRKPPPGAEIVEELPLQGGDAGSAEAWKNLGDALRKLGDFEAARNAYQSALVHQQHYPEAHFNLGILFVDMGRIDEAAGAFRRALLQHPGCVPAHTNLAALHYNAGRDIDALRELDKALRIAPTDARAQVIAARIHARRCSFRLAETICRKVLGQAPDYPQALVVLGQILADAERFDEALPILTRAVAIAPDDPEARHYLGVVLKVLGRIDEARDQFLIGLGQCETVYGTYHCLADLVDFSTDRTLLERVKTITHGLLTRDRPLVAGDDPLIPMHYTCAKALDDTGDHATALEHWIAGGKLKRATLSYDDAGHVRLCEEIKAVFSKEYLAGHRLEGNLSAAPVFILGMPRSGSTLIEQILASHPDVHGCGEVKFLRAAMNGGKGGHPLLSEHPAIMRELGPAQLRTIASTYLAAIGVQAGGAMRITDKLPTNYLFVGLIHLLFPNAKIINTMRNPVDTCLSMFATLFAEGMPYSYDFAELGAHYCHYIDLMAHWQAVLPPGVMCTVAYEDVVADTEGMARQLLGFLDLRWDDACMLPHKSGRPVKTASAAQVRKPVYTSAVARWKKYGPGLDPLISALGPSVGKVGGLPAREGGTGPGVRLVPVWQGNEQSREASGNARLG